MDTEITAEVVALSMVAHLGKHKYKSIAYLTSGFIEVRFIMLFSCALSPLY